jgi:hypothetical protein
MEITLEWKGITSGFQMCWTWFIVCDLEHIHFWKLVEFNVNNKVWEVVAKEKIEVSLSLE